MKKNREKAVPRPYEQYRQGLDEAERAAHDEFYSEFSSHCQLPRADTAKLWADFENALLWYAQNGVAPQEARARLDIANLGGFYVRPPVLWYALDDAAKIYPLSMKRGQMAVFRLSSYLKAPVVPQLLQMALTFVIRRFPSFATTLKKGFFWHYLDTAKRRFSIQEDNGLPCRPLEIGASGSQSFRVLYYRNRISIEFFHVLTDGTGGLIFLKTLTAEYLRLTGAAVPAASGLPALDDLPAPDETANEFARAGLFPAEKTAGRTAGFIDRPAVQMSGRLAAEKPYRVLHFCMPAAALHDAAKRHGATVTAYVLAQLFVAGRWATDGTEGEMSIQVPVNMRKFYPSATVRNFAMYCGIRLPLADIRSADALLPEITRQLDEKASQQAMSEMLASTAGMVSLLRLVPLFVKAPVARLVYGFLGDGIFSNTLSNLGVAEMPAGLAPYIDRMDFVLGTALTNRAGCGLITFGGTATLSVTKMTADPSFEEKLYALLCGDGIAVRVEGSAAP